MKFSDNDKMFLSGEKFSSGYHMKLEDNPLCDRHTILKKLFVGKNVMHIGCCDHIQLIDKKIENNTWLQRILDECCNEVLGIDINCEAVSYVNENRLAKNKVYCADVTDSSFNDVVPRKRIDYVFLGEILEHVDNPVMFLTKMRMNLLDYGFSGKYIITVPNAFSLQNKRYKKHEEFINSDHRYWFTPYTLAKVLVSAGIEPMQLYFAQYGNIGVANNKIERLFFFIMELICKKPLSINSYRGDVLIIIGKSFLI